MPTRSDNFGDRFAALHDGEKIEVPAISTARRIRDRFRSMQKFTVTISREIEADSAEEAALLVYQELSKEPPPLRYTVADETSAATNLTLDRAQADEFAEIDHTADPGNW